MLDRGYNQAFFEWIKIGRRGITAVELAAPFKILLGDDLARRRQLQNSNDARITSPDAPQPDLGMIADLGEPIIKMTGADGSTIQMTTRGVRTKTRIVTPDHTKNFKTHTNRSEKSSSKTLLVGEGGLEPP